MMSRRSIAALVVLFYVSACAETPPTATSTAATSQEAPPSVDGLEAKSEGNRIVTLSVKASDPANLSLSYKWSVDNGQLAGTTSSSVQWQVPSAPGTYTATVQVTNTKGLVAVATRKFTVDATGKADASGKLEVRSQPTSTALGGTGRFTIPSPVSGQATPVFVNGQPQTPPPADTASTPILQPVATPDTAISMAPLPQQPIATPPPTPLPSPFPPSPLPASPAPTAEPGVPVPPPLRWLQYDPGKVPIAGQQFRALHFPKVTRGWIVGTGGTVLLYNQTDPTVEPAMQFRNGLVPTTALLSQVYFTSDDKGFIAGDGVVMRTLDGGASWQSIANNLPTGFGVITSMVVYNEQLVVLSNLSGKVFRTTSGNAASATDVFWTEINTRPINRPADQVVSLNAGKGFATDTSLTYFGGDAIYRLDADNPDPEQVWKKVLALNAVLPGSTDLNDGVAVSVEMASQNELWVGTSTGNLLISANGGTSWRRLDRGSLLNREFNGNSPFLPGPGSLSNISIVDRNNVFLGGSLSVYDTTNGGSSWRRQSTSNFSDMQLNFVTTGSTADFTGWAIGGDGTVFRYRAGL